MPNAGDDRVEASPDGESSPATTTETFTRTIRCRAETSQRKTELVEIAIEEFQAMAHYMGMMLPSIPENEWSPMNSHLYRMVRDEFDDATVKSKVALEAMKHAVENYQSWRERGKPGDRPTLGEGSFFILPSQDFELVENDRGFGLKAGFIPYKSEWFHLDVGSFQADFLERVVDSNEVARPGIAEFRLDGGELWIHLTITDEIKVYEASDVTTRVGVDLGERVIYAAAVVDDDGVQAVELEPGREFRHYRKRLDRKRERLAAQGDLRGVRQCRGERERYTEHVTHTVSRRIVDLAAEHAPSVIHLEDLTHYRETADDPIHDWPFALLQEKIAYKATAASIPVRVVDAANTSVTCRHCGQVDPHARNGTTFYCSRCDYEVHADVNAAINIAIANSE